MYMLNSVKRSAIFNEFTPEEQEKYFSIKEKAVSHHVDTLYYSVFIKNDDVNIKDERIIGLLHDIHDLKQAKLSNLSTDVQFFGLCVQPFGAQVPGGLYMNRLSYEENFDIFISDYIPNAETPRIQVQLRTRSLVLNGLYNALEESYKYVKDILDYYGLEIYEIVENRIDYAFHTNIIQKPMEMFCDESVKKHVVTNFRELWKHIWLVNRNDEFFDLDYFALGSRRSKTVYFRVYAKAKEVVQKHYKAFFFKVWLDRGLISEYDKFVYEKAYEMKSFKTGCLVGRIKWYLEFGSNDALKDKLQKLLESCNVNSDNNPRIEKEIKVILPPPTEIMNVEFETKRKFYLKLSDFISSYEFTNKGSEELRRFYKVLDLRREIINKLCTDVVSFTVDRTNPDAEEMDWWKRIRRVRIEDQPDKAVLDAWYTYSRNVDVQRSKRTFAGNLASLAMLQRDEASESTFSEDIWDAITLLNDNHIEDMDRKIFDKLTPSSYKDIQKKKSRQLRPILKKKE